MFGTPTLDRAVVVCRAIGDIARLKLLIELMDHERAVSELADVSTRPMLTVSQQLRSLRLAHLVKRRRVGKQLLYSIASTDVHGVLRLLLAHAGKVPNE